MRHGRMRNEWRHTSEHLALHLNINRDKKKKPKPWQPHELDSYRLSLVQQKHGTPKGDITLLKVFAKPLGPTN